MTTFDEQPIDGSSVGIIGGSIAGCAAAIALTRLGCSVEIFERSSGALRDRGSGIGIPAVLRDELIEHGYLPTDYPHVPLGTRRWIADDGTAHGRTVWSIGGAAVANNWGVLWKGLRARVDDDRYHDGVDVRGVESKPDQAIVHFADGTARTFDVLIGADGYGSSVRQALVPQAVPDFAGYVLWRGNFPEAELSATEAWERCLVDDSWISVGYDGGHGVMYPIPDFDSDGSPGRRRVNWAIYAPTPAGLEIEGTMSLPPGSITEALYAQFLDLLDRAFPEVVRPVFTSPRHEVSIQPIYDLTIDSYVHDRVVLIGDAGTVSRPHTGSGATKAMQDARLLESLGAKHTQWGPLLAAYDEDRTSAGNDLVALGRRIGRDQVENPPPWLDMSASDFEAWTAGTLSGQQLYLYDDDRVRT